MTHQSMDTNSIQFGEPICFIDITYSGRNDSKIVVSAKPTPAGATACKPGNLEQSAQPVGSLTGWAVCFPGGSAGLNLPGCSPGFRFFQAVGLVQFFFFAAQLLLVWEERLFAILSCFPSCLESFPIECSVSVWNETVIPWRNTAYWLTPYSLLSLLS